LIRREHLDIAARNLAKAAPGNPALVRALRRWHAAETAMLAWHQVRALKVGGFAATVAGATRLDAAWPLTLAGESLRWLRRRCRDGDALWWFGFRRSARFPTAPP